ncbi:MAG: P-loop domain-containing protein [Bacteroidales bacterium]
MKTAQELTHILNRINKKGYKAYKDIEGEYYFEQERYTLIIDHVQGDPFASPSKLRITLSQDIAKFSSENYNNKSREEATRDFITRSFAASIKRHSKGSRGSGKSGKISIDKPGQEILERTSAFINNEQIEVRFTLGLPAYGRKIAGEEAKKIFFDEIPAIVNDSIIYENINKNALEIHYKTNEDADFLRASLKEKGLIAFVANDSVLPRRSGIDSRPMEKEEAIPFRSPDTMAVEFNLPNKGQIRGMGIPKGINLIVGGGFHGKSTLLQALEMGIYNHIPGDGREYVITNPMAVKIRSEDLTQKVKEIVETHAGIREAEGGQEFGTIKKRFPVKESIDPSKGKKRKKIKTGGQNAIQFGQYVIDIGSVEQIVDTSQVNAIGEAIVYSKKYMKPDTSLREIIDRVAEDIEEKGLSTIGQPTNGNYAFFRKTELAAALNRLRSLEIE